MQADDLIRMDAATGTELGRTSIPTLRNVFIAPDAVWVTTDDAAIRLDPITLTERSRTAVDDPWGIAVDETDAYVTSFRSNRLYRIDQSSSAGVETLELGPMPAESDLPATTEVVVANGSAWVIHGAEIVRVGLPSKR